MDTNHHVEGYYWDSDVIKGARISEEDIQTKICREETAIYQIRVNEKVNPNDRTQRLLLERKHIKSLRKEILA